MGVPHARPRARRGPAAEGRGGDGFRGRADRVREGGARRPAEEADNVKRGGGGGMRKRVRAREKERARARERAAERVRKRKMKIKRARGSAIERVKVYILFIGNGPPGFSECARARARVYMPAHTFAYYNIFLGFSI